MTDPQARDARSIDELVSAVLDGEASAEEHARVHADPTLRERLAEFQAVADLMSAAADPPRAEDLDRVRAAALDAADAAATSDVTAVPPPVQLAARRRRARRIELPSPALAAAFLVVLALIGIGLVIRGSNGNDSSDTASSPQATEGATQDAGAAGKSSDAVNEEGTGAPLAGSLGSFATQAELTRVLAALDPATFAPNADAAAATTAPPAPTSTTTPPTSTAANSRATEQSEAVDAPAARQTRTAAIDRCDRVVRAVPGQALGARLAVTEAVLDGRPVLVFSHPQRQEDPAARESVLMSVVDDETCEILFAVQRERT